MHKYESNVAAGAKKMENTRELWGNVESMIYTILKGTNISPPNAVEGFAPQNGFRKVEAVTMPVEDHEASTILGIDAADFETSRALLGVIFQKRYCWTEERIDDMTLPEVVLALEHAMEYDAPSKQSVWDL